MNKNVCEKGEKPSLYSNLAYPNSKQIFLQHAKMLFCSAHKTKGKGKAPTVKFVLYHANQKTNQKLSDCKEKQQ